MLILIFLAHQYFLILHQKQYNFFCQKKILEESQNPFKGLRRILWIAFSGSAFLGLLIMLSKIASGSELQQNNILIQLGACVIFPTLLILDRNKD